MITAILLLIACVTLIVIVSAKTKTDVAIFTGEVIQLDSMMKTLSVRDFAIKDKKVFEVFDISTSKFPKEYQIYFGLSCVNTK